MNIEDRILSLSLAPSAQGEGDISSVERSLTAALGEGYRISNHGDEVEFVNFQLSLGIVLEQGLIKVSDYSGTSELRAEFMAIVFELQNLLREHELLSRYHEWKVEGVVADVEQIAPMGRLFDVQWIDRVIGGDAEPAWMAEELKLTSTSTVVDWLDISLRWIPSIQGVTRLEFRMTGMIDDTGPWDATDLHSEGSAFQSGAFAIMERLFEEEPAG